MYVKKKQRSDWNNKRANHNNDNNYQLDGCSGLLAFERKKNQSKLISSVFLPTISKAVKRLVLIEEQNGILSIFH